MIFYFYRNDHGLFDDLMNFFIFKFESDSVFFFNSMVFNFNLRANDSWKIWASLSLSIINWFSLLTMLHLNKKCLSEMKWLTKNTNVLIIFIEISVWHLWRRLSSKIILFSNSTIPSYYQRRQFCWDSLFVWCSRSFYLCVSIFDTISICLLAKTSFFLHRSISKNVMFRRAMPRFILLISRISVWSCYSNFCLLRVRPRVSLFLTSLRSRCWKWWSWFCWNHDLLKKPRRSVLRISENPVSRISDSILSYSAQFFEPYAAEFSGCQSLYSTRARRHSIWEYLWRSRSDFRSRFWRVAKIWINDDNIYCFVFIYANFS